MADEPSNSQKQLKGLENFCSENHMVVNDVKTKFMVYGKTPEFELLLNGHRIERVKTYKSLGTILSETSSINGDIFKNNTNYLNEKAKNGIFLLKQSTKFLGNLPPVHMLYLYESMIEPILLYGSDLWGSSKTCTQNINKVFLWFVRIVLNIKSTTSNIITMGESGMIPPNIKCHINAITYFIRLNSMKSGPVIKNVFNELHNFHNLGFKNWYSNVLELAKQYNIDPTSLEYNMSTKKSIKSIVCASFIESWKLELQNTEKIHL